MSSDEAARVTAAPLIRSAIGVDADSAMEDLARLDTADLPVELLEAIAPAAHSLLAASGYAFSTNEQSYSPAELDAVRYELCHRASEDAARAFLIGYGARASHAATVVTEAHRFPGTWSYTGDRDAAVVDQMPADTYLTADAREVERHIASLCRKDPR